MSHDDEYTKLVADYKINEMRFFENETRFPTKFSIEK